MLSPPRTNLPSVLDARAAQQLGLTQHAVQHRLSTGRWQRMARGVYLTHSGRPTAEERATAELVACGPAAVLAGVFALRMHGLRTSRPLEPLVILVPRSARRPSNEKLVVRHTTRLPQAHIRGGIPVAPVARCVVEACLVMANLNNTRELVAATVQQRLCAAESVQAELELAQKRGSANLRQVLSEVMNGAESVAECEVAELLRAAGISGFEQNAEIRDSAGHRRRGDFVWRELRCVLEIDGQEWHLSPSAWRHTLQRHNQLDAAGYAVMHLSPAQIRADPAGCIALIRQWLADRARLLAA